MPQTLQELIGLDTVPYTDTAIIYTAVSVYNWLKTVRKKLPKMVDGTVTDRTGHLRYNTEHKK
jgi:hypothetical protein